jgi:hypothetical protein
MLGYMAMSPEDATAERPGAPVADPPVADARFSALILELCTARGVGKSICPSEVARAASGDPNDGVRWRALMRQVRAAAAALQDAGAIQVLRKNKPVDIRTVKGVIRLALPRNDG